MRRGWRRESIIDVYELALGMFLFVSPWLFKFAHAATLETWMGSAAVIATSVAAIVAFSKWEEWFNALLGVWLIVSPWILGFAHTTAMHVSIGVGVVVTYLALLELYLLRFPEDIGAPMARQPQ